MKNTFVFLLVLVLVSLLSGCPVTITEGGDIERLDPLKDDKTTVADFRSSKFDGFWRVINLEMDWDNPPVLDNQPIMYVFKKNNVQVFTGSRDWANDGNLSGIDNIFEMSQFMYSDTAIYTLEFRNYMAWIKRGYELSADGKHLRYGRDRLEKMELEPWTKEDLLGTWYYGDLEGSYTTYTFTLEDPFFDIYLFVQQPFVNGHPYKDIYFDDYSISAKIGLTDEYFYGNLNFTGSPLGNSNIEETCYYYLIDGKLFLSNRRILNRYPD
jgi:hypothetical protein